MYILKNKHSHEPTVHELCIMFLKLCMLCKNVICCRVSPLQKALVVKLVKNNLIGSITLAIGDGANDVSMIQAAHIGVGISGEEGMQAARASDYSIAQFRFLKTLLLVHGRYNYRRITKLICYCFYKNAALMMIQFWYVWYNAFTGKSVYDNLSLILFNIVFSSLPIIAFALFDRDVSVESSLNVPQLYILGQRSYYYNMRVFFGWIFNGIWHSIACFFVPLYVLNEAMLRHGVNADHNTLSYLVYTCLIVVITLKVGVESATWTWVHFFTFFISMALWFIVSIVYSEIWPLVERILRNGKWSFFEVIRTSSRGAKDDFYNSSTNALFWFAVLITVVMALSRDVSWKSIVRNLKYKNLLRQVYHVVQDMEHSNVDIDPESVSQRYPDFVDLKPYERKIAKEPKNLFKSSDQEYGSNHNVHNQNTGYQSLNQEPNDRLVAVIKPPIRRVYTGYSFSQTERGQADFVRQMSMNTRDWSNVDVLHDEEEYEENANAKTPLINKTPKF
ncbi:phospholipid-transporting ATPase Atp8 [Acrasis kona]|uniref:Phospholipid-transporting ATPase Atp8 n=1 Tax=Acrasis kona TaxID=1008807 RepID=A0AAW2ZNA9_9EUKA